MFTHVKDKPVLQELKAITTEHGRRYITPDGLKYPSVTTVLGAQPEKKAGLLAWRKRVGEEEANKISHRASTRGTAVHELAENYLNNKEDWADGFMPANIFSFNAIKPILDDHVDNIYWQEAPLYSDKLKTAGRVDMICEWKGELAIVDFKTSRKPKKREWITDYFLQMAFYSAALFEQTGLVAKKGVIVMTVDDNPSEVFEESTFEWLPKFIDVRKQYDSY